MNSAQRISKQHLIAWCAILCAGAFGQAKDPPSTGGLSPVYKTPGQLGDSLTPPPLDLAIVSQKPLALHIGANRIPANWVMRTAHDTPVAVRIEVSDRWTSVANSVALDVSRWAYGGLYEGPVTVQVPPFTIVGDATIRFTVIRGSGDTTEQYEVARIPCRIPFATLASSISQDVVSAHFGDAAVPINVACRMAPGDEFTVAIPQELQRTTNSFAVISCLRYDAGMEQGETVATIATDGGFTPEMRAGIETSLGEYDAPRPGVVKITKAPLFDLTPHTGVTWEGKPLDLHRYVGVVKLPSAVPLTHLRIRHAGPSGVLDIFEIVLLDQDGPSR